MDKNVLVPVLAGLGLGWLAFHPGGQEVARGLGQIVMPALSGGKPDEGGALPGRQTGGQPDQKEQDGKKDKDDED